MYCNCKEITGVWNELNQRIFPLLEGQYRGAKKREIPLVEVIRNEAMLRGQNKNPKIDQLFGQDLFYLQVTKCRCKNRPLLRFSEKCLSLDDLTLSSAIALAVKMVKEGAEGSFTVEADGALKELL